jgi:hypothetical protein
MLEPCDCVLCKNPNRVVNSHDVERFREMSNRVISSLDTPEKARAYLVRLGTHRPDGSLTEAFGGEPDEDR